MKAVLQISLKAARINAGKTQKDAANAIGVSNRTIVKWENGKTLPRADQLNNLCALYKVPVNAIFLPVGLPKAN